MSRDPVLADFDKLVQRRAGHAFVLSPSRQATVGDVDDLARGIAGSLAGEQIGPGPGRLVGLAIANGPAFLAGLVALRRLGYTVLMLDRRSPQIEQERIARGLGAIGVLHSPSGWPDQVGEIVLEPIVAADDTVAPELPPGIGMTLLTSGTTGTPQGILRRMEAFAADDEALTVTMGLATDERILAAIPFSHAYALGSVVLPALRRGQVLIVPDESNPLDALRAASEGEVTFLPTVPAYLQAVLKMSSPPPLPDSLRLVITAGAPLPPATATRFREVYGHPVHVFYGASEVGGICYDREGTAGERGTLGTPVTGVEVSLEAAQGVSEPGTGLVTVRSPAAAEGYFPVADPRLCNGTFRSSDLARFEHGELRLLGRVDSLINVRGKKVDPGEVERVLNQLDGVDEAVVFGVPLPDEGCEMVRAVIACRPGQLSSDQIRDRCRTSLATYKVPRSIILVDEIPRTARGKIDRAALHDLKPQPHG